MSPRKVIVVHRWQVVAVFLAVTVSYVVSVLLVQKVQTRLCRRVDHLDGTIVKTLHRSQKSLPANSYFQDHPDELRRQLRDIRVTIRDFQGDACK